MKTLRLFNCVIEKPSQFKGEVVDGIVITPEAMWAKDQIVSFYKKLSGKDLNNTPFYKSFQTVASMDRFELYLDQILHYSSTYGTGFEGEVYIPPGTADIPKELNLIFKLVKGVSRDELIKKCLDLLQSGIALSQQDVNDLLSILIDDLGYVFSGKEGVKNKEAVVILADKYGVIPNSTTEVLRLALYKSTGETLLIKNPKTILAIKGSSYDPTKLFNTIGFARMAEIFNRFKPLFLAYKKVCPTTINAISKLSKTHHKPLPQNVVNQVTDTNDLLDGTDAHWFKNATPFAFFKALSAIKTRLAGQTDFCYRIRNGKSWYESKPSKESSDVLAHNYFVMMDIARKRWALDGKKVFLPKGITYALPTSAKMFVGNVPTGTQFETDQLVIGIYWKNSWGAHDIDLSSFSVTGGKIGWNAAYHNKDMIYSGDVTNATNGASEYLHVKNANPEIQYLVKANVFYGHREGTKFKLIIGHDTEVSRDYIIDPNNVILEEEITTIQAETVLGLILGNKFTLLNFSAGQKTVSKMNPVQLSAIIHQANHSLMLPELLSNLGAVMVESPENADINLSLDNLSKDTFTQLFSEK